MAYQRKTNRAYRKIAMTEIGEAPCDQCRHAPRCGSELLACSVFSDWVNEKGSPDTDFPGEWAPTRKIYQAIYFSGTEKTWNEDRAITLVEDGPDRVQLTASREDAA
ncbi:MAG: hypothetical protein GXP38_05020 [Chloroflexi bacterium]|nr:hypothetical protein [Chloroflexota bacterium]